MLAQPAGHGKGWQSNMDKHAAYYNGPVRWTANGPIRITIPARKQSWLSRLLAWLRG